MFDKKIIPLSKQPAYQAAMAKVVEISRAMGHTTEQLTRCRAQADQILNSTPTKPSMLDRALSLASGISVGAAPVAVPETLANEIARLEDEERCLKAGMVEASNAADRIAGDLAHEVTKIIRPAHVAAVKNVLDCMEKLVAANKAEWAVINELQKHGYDRHSMQRYALTMIGETNDQNGCPAYYFAREAKEYIANHS